MPSTLMDIYMEKLAGINLLLHHDVYVDGISITSGNPRKHVWTYAVGLSDDYNYLQFNCPCAKTPGQDPPTFVGNYYYCESGSTGIFDNKQAILHTNDPL